MSVIDMIARNWVCHLIARIRVGVLTTHLRCLFARTWAVQYQVGTCFRCLEAACAGGASYVGRKFPRLENLQPSYPRLSVTPQALCCARSRAGGQGEALSARRSLCAGRWLKRVRAGFRWCECASKGGENGLGGVGERAKRRKGAKGEKATSRHELDISSRTELPVA